METQKVCKNCANYITQKCIGLNTYYSSACTRYRKLTNFDYITASPERLAEWWYDEKEDICQGSAQNVPCSGKCEQCLLEWFKQEVKTKTED